MWAAPCSYFVKEIWTGFELFTLTIPYELHKLGTTNQIDVNCQRKFAFGQKQPNSRLRIAALAFYYSSEDQ